MEWRYYGIPDDTNTQVLFMNTADFKAAGLTAPTTYAQMMADAQTLTIPSKASTDLALTAPTSGTSDRCLD